MRNLLFFWIFWFVGYSGNRTISGSCKYINGYWNVDVLLTYLLLNGKDWCDLWAIFEVPGPKKLQFVMLFAIVSDYDISMRSFVAFIYFMRSFDVQRITFQRDNFPYCILYLLSIQNCNNLFDFRYNFDFTETIKAMRLDGAVYNADVSKKTIV